MMPSPLLLVGAALFLFISRNIYCLRQNIAAAKASGIPYILSREYLASIVHQDLIHRFSPSARSLVIMECHMAAYKCFIDTIVETTT
jgi:hypothetical protein